MGALTSDAKMRPFSASSRPRAGGPSPAASWMRSASTATGSCSDRREGRTGSPDQRSRSRTATASQADLARTRNGPWARQPVTGPCGPRRRMTVNLATETSRRQRPLPTWPASAKACHCPSAGWPPCSAGHHGAGHASAWKKPASRTLPSQAASSICATVAGGLSTPPFGPPTAHGHAVALAEPAQLTVGRTRPAGPGMRP